MDVRLTENPVTIYRMPGLLTFRVETVIVLTVALYLKLYTMAKLNNNPLCELLYLFLVVVDLHFY